MVMRLRGAEALKEPGVLAEPTLEEATWGAEQILKNEEWGDDGAGAAGGEDQAGEMTAEEGEKRVIAEQDRQKDREWKAKRIGEEAGEAPPRRKIGAVKK